MPVYEYKCKICDEQFEIEQSFTEDTLTTLEGCTVDDSGQHELKKVFRAVGISFKGDGFYRNDSRSGSSGSSTSSTSGSSGSESGSSSSGPSDGGSSSSGSSDSSSSSSDTKKSTGASDKATT